MIIRVWLASCCLKSCHASDLSNHACVGCGLKEYHASCAIDLICSRQLSLLSLPGRINDSNWKKEISRFLGSVSGIVIPEIEKLPNTERHLETVTTLFLQTVK